MFASSIDPLYDVSLSWTEADALRALRGREAEALLHTGAEPGRAWEVRIAAADGLQLSVVPEEFPTPTKGRSVLDVERPVVRILDKEAGETEFDRHALGMVREVAVHTTMVWWSVPEEHPDGASGRLLEAHPGGAIGHPRNLVRPADVATLERAKEEVAAAGFDAGITRLDVGIEVQGARTFTVWTNFFFLYWALDGPVAELTGITERRPLA
jgi:hypothetical protein